MELEPPGVAFFGVSRSRFKGAALAKAPAPASALAPTPALVLLRCRLFFAAPALGHLISAYPATAPIPASASGCDSGSGGYKVMYKKMSMHLFLNLTHFYLIMYANAKKKKNISL